MIRIGEFADLFDVTIKTIRLYEEKKILIPCYVDNYTGYRYYDEKNIEQMTKIVILKDLGLSLKEIETFDFDIEKVNSKVTEYEKQVKKINSNIELLRSLSQNKEDVYKMKKFINDENLIGKWELVGVSNDMESAKESKFIEDGFNIKELFILPNGEKYWVISWTKGTIFLKGMACDYILEKDKMYLKVSDRFDESFFKIVVYKNIDRKEYTEVETRVKDNIDLEFIPDNELLGCFKTVDFVSEKDKFNPLLQTWQDELYLDKIMVSSDKDCIVTYKDNQISPKQIKYTKNYFINLSQSDTASNYEMFETNGEKYMIVEWKSGDYIYGKMINGYYVLKKI